MTVLANLKNNMTDQNNNFPHYTTLIEKHGIFSALAFVVATEKLSFLEQSVRADIKKTLSINFRTIIETQFVHCKGHPLEVTFGECEELGAHFEVICSHCYGFDSVHSKPLGYKDGRLVFRASDKWESGMKRIEVPTHE
ncbi:hypothetical protein D3C71_1372990 [compost metagenome]